MLIVPKTAAVLSIVTLGSFYGTDESWHCPSIARSFLIEGGQAPYWVTVLESSTLDQLYPDVLGVLGDPGVPKQISSRVLTVGKNITFAVEDGTRTTAYSSSFIVNEGNRIACQ